jgi:hypothetical protein
MVAVEGVAPSSGTYEDPELLVLFTAKMVVDVWFEHTVRVNATDLQSAASPLRRINLS